MDFRGASHRVSMTVGPVSFGGEVAWVQLSIPLGTDAERICPFVRRVSGCAAQVALRGIRESYDGGTEHDGVLDDQPADAGQIWKAVCRVADGGHPCLRGCD